MGFMNRMSSKQPSTITPFASELDTRSSDEQGMAQQTAAPLTLSPSNVDGGDFTPIVSSPTSNTTVSPNGTAQQAASSTSNSEGENSNSLIDWSKPYSEIEKNSQLQKMTPYDIMRDFEKNGNGDFSSFMPWLSKYDPDMTVDQSVKAQKKAERQAKWERIGNLLSHLGNFVGTAMGAVPQKLESAQELNDRQRKIRESTDALRKQGYDNMLKDIYKERADRQAQLKAEAEAKANQARADYYGSQKHQVDALTPEKVKTEQSRQGASDAAASLSRARKDTEDALRGKKADLLTSQAENQRSSAADHRAGVAVKGAQVRHINSQTEGQNIKNAGERDADDFNELYVNDPDFREKANRWAKNNGMAVGNNVDGRGGTWANKNNRQQAMRWAKSQQKYDRTPPSRRPGAGHGSKVPPSRRGGGKIPPSRR